MESVTGYVGRTHEITRALDSLRRGSHLLVTGRAGIGKSSFLKQLYERVKEERLCFWVHAGNVKNMVFKLAEQVHGQIGLAVPEELVPKSFRFEVRKTGTVKWEWIKRTLRRLPARECMQLIVDSVKDHNTLVFIESLEVPPTQAEFFTQLILVAQVAATIDETNRRSRIQKLLWHFPERDRISLKPLTHEECIEIAEKWLQAYPIRFESPKVREAFLKAISQDSGGVPAAVRGMLETATAEQEITRAKVRSFIHEAGVRYINMTPVFLAGLMGLIILRYIGRGLGSQEIYLLSGILFSLTTILRFVLYKLK
jgi:hypothetical protein